MIFLVIFVTMAMVHGPMTNMVEIELRGLIYLLRGDLPALRRLRRQKQFYNNTQMIHWFSSHLAKTGINRIVARVGGLLLVFPIRLLMILIMYMDYLV